jgi:hypothetical protein
MNGFSFKVGLQFSASLAIMIIHNRPAGCIASPHKGTLSLGPVVMS